VLGRRLGLKEGEKEKIVVFSFLNIYFLFIFSISETIVVIFISAKQIFL
jgi:hypothetical protein